MFEPPHEGGQYLLNTRSTDTSVFLILLSNNQHVLLLRPFHQPPPLGYNNVALVLIFTCRSFQMGQYKAQKSRLVYCQCSPVWQPLKAYCFNDNCTDICLRSVVDAKRMKSFNKVASLITNVTRAGGRCDRLLLLHCTSTTKCTVASDTLPL